ncbi:MAG: lytic transglycosylase domain-containing protein [Eubacteriales bacterium]|nr:lytic transglycosylase domain-containing protein [Eubacteriales bacterium]
MENISALDIINRNQYTAEAVQIDKPQAAEFDTVYNGQVQGNSLEEVFNRVAGEVGVDVNLLKAVAQAESGFDPEAVSSCGAMGIMQLMPSTAESMGVTDPFDAEQNIRGGAEVLSYLLEDYDGNVSLALAAYNAGSGNVAKYGGIPPFKETINYINKINAILGGTISNASAPVSHTVETKPSETEKSKAYDADVSLLSFEEYMYFFETYEKLMEKLFALTDKDKTEGAVLKSHVQSAYKLQNSMLNPLAEKLLNIYI